MLVLSAGGRVHSAPERPVLPRRVGGVGKGDPQTREDGRSRQPVYFGVGGEEGLCFCSVTANCEEMKAPPLPATLPGPPGVAVVQVPGALPGLLDAALVTHARPGGPCAGRQCRW